MYKRAGAFTSDHDYAYNGEVLHIKACYLLPSAINYPVKVIS